MTDKYADVSDDSKKFYYYIGLLSTKFAMMEYNILHLLGLMIVDDFVLTNTLLDRNSLSQNIELLKRINKYKRFEEETIAKLLRQISNIRSDRNLFIHGIWSSPRQEGNDVVVTCSEPKITYKEYENGRRWTDKRHSIFKLSDIKKRIDEIDRIITTQENLIKLVAESEE